MSLLAVENLTVAFPGQVAVREVSFAIEPGETLALVGESGCGKSVTAFSVMRLLPPNARVVSRPHPVRGRATCWRPSPPEMRAIRGKQISLIQQEPMTSLNPVLSIGAADRRGDPPPRQGSRAAPRAPARIELLDLVSIPDAAPPHRRLSAQSERRHAPAGHDRHGGRLRSQAADRRRADHGARRHDPGAGARPARRSAPEARRWRCC